ncbi:GntR family transcriptional regulator [Hephaestia sp. GCM10023244]|uniref:GntR family transcriptional regulator n=1 Tax=unclassified Hephaestia TaxID=2631281 RepID=UPI0020775A95|nr:GntR family transcriptional regulator [Hephaestia sp. MAHUQ-44]
MNAGSITERVYDALKRRLTGGSYRPGERLDPTTLAETLISSVTPVRDALHRLTGERLVETHPGTGFSVPHVTDADLRDLYEWSGQILTLAVRHSGPRDPTAQTDITTPRLFERIAAQSRNVEHAAAISTLNARLALARSVEPGLLDDLTEELHAMARAFAADDKDLSQLIVRYHRRRIRAAAEIVRSLYRNA